MLEIYFVTSSRAKFLHARHLCQNYTISLQRQPHYGKSYDEPRIQDRKRLIEESIIDAEKRLDKKKHSKQDDNFLPLFENSESSLASQELRFNKFFIIEDTSVIIEALSPDQEVPGVDIKYWMRENDFESVDRLLKQAGNNRRVKVRSDVVLYLPPVNRLKEGAKDFYKIFTSWSCGTIAEHEFEIKTNALYPWLDNKTFNKWFIPEGENIPISLLPIEEADKHDFRSGAFSQLLKYFVQEGLIEERKPVVTVEQESFFPQAEPAAILICGLPCAGKSTLGDYLSQEYGLYHVEASDFMYLSYYEHHGIDSTVSIGDFAQEILQVNPGIVVDNIIKHLKDNDISYAIVTGFRSDKEIQLFKQKFNGFVQSYYIYADEKLRFERSLLRGRHDKVPRFEEFRSRDCQQLDMGLNQIQRELIASSITNDSTKEDFFRSFEEAAQIPEKIKVGATINKDKGSRPVRLDESIIFAMSQPAFRDKYLTTTEICRAINSCFPGSTNKNNVSRYFNQNFYPYYEIKRSRGKTLYHLSQTGLSRARYLNL